jgi:hypothetical protein
MEATGMVCPADPVPPGSLRNLPVAILLLAGLVPAAPAEPVPAGTTVLGPFTGPGAPVHPDNLHPHPVRYYGTDLGWTYEHGGRIHFLFGDTYATEEGERIEASSGDEYDDAFGTIDIAAVPDPSRIGPGNIPPIRIAQNPGTTEAAALDPGHIMESFKTPLGGFSNGRREFALFYTSKPLACRVDTDCGADFSCDAGLGYYGEPWDTDRGLTIPCIDGSSGCNAATMNEAAGAPAADSGFCVDRGSTVWAGTDAGRVAAVVLKQLAGIRSTTDPRRYTDTRNWYTNRFANVAVRTVEDFNPARAGGHDFRPATGSGGDRRVFLWGRPGFIGVAATGRPLGLYFAFADMPEDAPFEWALHYYAGSGADGRPRFSRNERDAVPVDLDSRTAGVQPDEVHDIVDQMSLSWVEPLGKWIMFYGGGLIDLPMETLPECGVLEFFTRGDCRQVNMGNGAIRMRSADQPWGPWTPPLDVIVGGDPKPLPPEHLYAPGGVLRHIACTAPNCAPHTRAREAAENEHGFLYGANIIEQWTLATDGGVDILWNASTWDPYGVILLRTRIEKVKGKR